MQLILKSLYAGPAGVFHPGQVLDAPEQLPLHEAQALIAGGYAAWLCVPAAWVVEPPPTAPETAMLSAATVAQAIRPAPKPRVRRAR
jgi:hypothetical protein